MRHSETPKASKGVRHLSRTFGARAFVRRPLSVWIEAMTAGFRLESWPQSKEARRAAAPGGPRKERYSMSVLELVDALAVFALRGLHRSSHLLAEIA